MKTLAEVAGAKIDEVFIGSCMTNIGHFRAASKLLEGKRDIPVKLWIAPPTKMDAQQLTEEGHYGVFGNAGARMEMPGCSLCMGNQAQVTRGRDRVLDQHAQLPEPPGQELQRVPGQRRAGRDLLQARAASRRKEEYMADMGVLDAPPATQVYQYLNFDKIDEYQDVAEDRGGLTCRPPAKKARFGGLFLFSSGGCTSRHVERPVLRHVLRGLAGDGRLHHLEDLHHLAVLGIPVFGMLDPHGEQAEIGVRPRLAGTMPWPGY